MLGARGLNSVLSKTAADESLPSASLVALSAMSACESNVVKFSHTALVSLSEVFAPDNEEDQPSEEETSCVESLSTEGHLWHRGSPTEDHLRAGLRALVCREVANCAAHFHLSRHALAWLGRAHQLPLSLSCDVALCGKLRLLQRMSGLASESEDKRKH